MFCSIGYAETCLNWVPCHNPESARSRWKTHPTTIASHAVSDGHSCVVKTIRPVLISNTAANGSSIVSSCKKRKKTPTLHQLSYCEERMKKEDTHASSIVLQIAEKKEDPHASWKRMKRKKTPTLHQLSYKSRSGKAVGVFSCAGPSGQTRDTNC